MTNKKMTVFLVLVISAAVFISGCTEKVKEPQISGTLGGSSSSTQQEKSTKEASQNKSLSKDKKANKEAILKEMMDAPIEDFEAVDLQGNKVKLSDYKGKIVFLNFWATWCPPCKEEMPLMEQLYKEYKEQDVVILAVNPTSVELRGGTDSSKAENLVRKFIKENGYSFPVLLDKDDSAWSIYQQRGIPANYVIDKQGIIRYGFAGAFQSKEQMVEFIENIRAIE